MYLNEISFNIVFDYTKDIRRYSYDIEEFLKSNNLFSSVAPVPPVPDEVEPMLPRLNVTKQLKGKRYNISISQVSIAIQVQFQQQQCSFSELDNQKEEIESNIRIIKDYLKTLIKDFNILYEGIIVISSGLFKNKEEIKLAEINEVDDEIRNKLSNEIDDERLFIQEYSILKTYQLKGESKVPLLIKNAKENFMGWNVVLFKEINNRLKYNNSKEHTNNELNIQDSLEFLKSEFEKDF